MANTALKDSSDKPYVRNWNSRFFQNKNKKNQTLIGHPEYLQENDLAPPKHVDEFPGQESWLVGSGNQRNA